MRRLGVVLMTLTLVLLAAPHAQARPFCGIRWGSLDKTSAPMSAAPVVDLRAGEHRCFDRLVFDIDGNARGYHVAYVDEVQAEGSGAVVPLRGAAALSVTVRSPAYDENAAPTYHVGNRRELVPVRGFRTFRQVAWAGSFEGQTTVGLGVRARLPFRVFTLDGPGDAGRLVIDVAHRW